MDSEVLDIIIGWYKSATTIYKKDSFLYRAILFTLFSFVSKCLAVRGEDKMMVIENSERVTKALSNSTSIKFLC